jgi:hypothetical protein
VCLGISEVDEEDEQRSCAPSLYWWFVMAARRCNAICTIDAMGADD